MITIVYFRIAQFNGGVFFHLNDEKCIERQFIKLDIATFYQASL